MEKTSRNRLVISKTTKFLKYGPSGVYTKAAKGTKSITQYFSAAKNNESTDSESKNKSETSDTDIDVDAFNLGINADEDINNNDTNRDATVFDNLEIDDDFNLEGDDNNDFSSDRKSTRLNSSHTDISRMPSS